jgi:hypothetical protein
MTAPSQRVAATVMLLDLESLNRSPLALDPFNYTVVPHFIRPAAAALVQADFPVIGAPGLLPVKTTRHGPRFAALIRELQSEAVAQWPSAAATGPFTATSHTSVSGAT